MSPVPNDAAPPTLEAVHDFWNAASCGEDLYLNGADRAAYARQSRTRYELEPMIEELARFAAHRGEDVLEIGVGLGADHQRWAEAGARLHGVDLTERAVEHTRRRLALFGLASELRVANAEALPFADASFDVVYSWGVLMHTPSTERAIAEVHRVLRSGGRALLMLYHRSSFVGYMLWLRYALLRARPFTSLDEIYARHLESPGTKAYSIDDARRLMSRFEDVRVKTHLTHGDLLTSEAGQRHRGALLTTAKKLWPRRAIRTFFPSHGLFMTIDARKA